MLHFKYILIVGVVLLLPAVSCSAADTLPLKADKYIITFEENALSEQWAKYLFNHLSRRSKDKSSVILKNGTPDYAADNVKVIHLEVTGDLKNNYCIDHTVQKLHIRVQNGQTALWIIYQLIDKIAVEDVRFTTTDMPPAIINFDSKCRDFDFVYREPYFSPNLKPEYAPIIGTNNVEINWGIWGHNLSKLLGKGYSENVYALIDGRRNRAQFSFSSPELFEQISNTIANNYGKGEKQTYRFMIMPEDNGLVCLCSACTGLGNTKDNATPAVTDLVNKLANRFPKHQFFTTAYRTTSMPPTQQLAENTGVFFSTIDLPKGIELDEEEHSVQQFVEHLDVWKSKTPNIYLWDYASNFDDYLTPIPVLYGLQKQLAFFHELGVKGIFLNASGYDYTPFDDVKTLVAGALMIDTEIDVDTLCRKYFLKEYPVSNELLANYYLSLEKQFSEKNKTYDMYGSMRKNMDSYFDDEQFISFYNELKAIIPKTKDIERNNLQKLFTALSYTRLQIAYVNGVNERGFAHKEGKKIIIKPEINDFLKSLENFTKYPDLKRYKETDGLLSDYVGEWKQLISRGSYSNALLDTPVEVLSKVDEGFEKSNLLNDGTPGFAIDYHQGWYLSSTDDLHIMFSTEHIQQSKSIRVRFLNNEKHGIYPPEIIVVVVDGKQIDEIYPDRIKNLGKTAECSINLNLSGTEDVRLKFIRKKTQKSIIACDEIMVLN